MRITYVYTLQVRVKIFSHSVTYNPNTASLVEELALKCTTRPPSHYRFKIIY